MNDILSQEEVTALLNAVNSCEMERDAFGVTKKEGCNMGITVGKDCVTLDDGSMLCYDKKEKCFFVFRKKKVESSDLSSKDLIKLVEHLASIIKED